MHKKARPVVAALSLVAFGLTSTAFAAPKEDACAALAEARAALVSMLDAKDKPAQDELNAKVQTASAKLDQTLNGMQSGADAKAAGEFKSVWEAFKSTREKQIIPSIYAGKPDEGKKLATGVQAERMTKMKGLFSCK